MSSSSSMMSMSLYATYGRKPPRPPPPLPLPLPFQVPVFIYDSNPSIPPKELKPISLISVPYRGAPKYNTRRRLTNPILRRRSLSQSSICSAQSERYQTPQNLLLRQQQHHPQMGLASPSPSCLTMCPSNSGSTGEYGTLRRYAPDAIPSAPRAGFEPNVPRILVIPRGPKGFGFILRGAKHVDSEVEFEPTPLCPALQFFEGVDMSGMAMKAGLRPGDFLLEINGVDVRCASHEQVVHLIHQSDDTITLKVITIDNNPNNNGNGGGHYGPGMNGTIQSRRNHSVPRNILPPMPPQRHPSTSLSFARGGPVQQSMGFSSKLFFLKGQWHFGILLYI
uniref:PDZ domain-containing protein n=1 Tax=Panagrolaimus superbus TaxID=310955 RepID=A0A914YLS5_9BILA